MLQGEGIVGKLRVTHKRQQITPAMRFTCTGWITKWIIGVAWKHSDTFYLELQLWRSSGDRSGSLDIAGFGSYNTVVTSYTTEPSLSTFLQGKQDLQGSNALVRGGSNLLEPLHEP